MDDARALELAYRFISRRERTEFEVRSRLEREDFSAEQIEAAVSELVELGSVDDARYARLFTQDRRSLDAWGRDRIVRTLRERGVSAEFIDAALNADAQAGPHAALDGDSYSDLGVAQDGQHRGPPPGEYERALALLSERFPAGPGSVRDHNRAFGVLARKGYESEVAADAVRAWARHARS